MSVETSLTILVVILSTTLAIFLVLGIIALVKTIQVLNYTKSIMQKAEEIADKAEAVTEFFQKTAGPVAIGRLISNVADSVLNRSKKD